MKNVFTNQLLEEAYYDVAGRTQFKQGDKVTYKLAARPGQEFEGEIIQAQNFVRGGKNINRFKIKDGPWISHDDIIQQVGSAPAVESVPSDSNTKQQQLDYVQHMTPESKIPGC